MRDPPPRDEQGRNRAALALLPLALIAPLVGLLLLVDSHPTSAPTTRTAPREPSGKATSTPTTVKGVSASELRAARRMAREFLSGYLAAVYGRAGVTGIEHAAPALRAELQRRPPRVTPAQAAQRPRLRTLVARVAPGGQVRAVAHVEGNRTLLYRLELGLQRSRAGWVVVDVAPR